VTAAALALAVAALIGGGPLAVRLRAGTRHARAWPAHRPVRESAPVHDPLGGASALDLFAVCLSSGMAVSTAARATAPSAPPALARILGRAADLLALGADPATAWAPPAGDVDEQSRALLRLARRSAASGAALADSVAELAVESRHDAARAADAAAERAGVVIAGPLGVCFLPAFICLGVVPVVAGLAGDVLTSGLL
jgi:pilus assembly protein TadC